MYYWKPGNKKKLIGFYSQFVNPGDLCFDIGAHVGNRTSSFLALGASVVAVDPQPLCLQYLQQRFKGQPTVNVLGKAVSDRTGDLTLHISHATPTITTASNEAWRSRINDNAWYEVKWEEKCTVEATTLDQLIEEFGVPAFCKIDVENYEAKVLAGLSQPIPCLSFEYFPPHLTDTLQCFDLLEQLGEYRYNWSFGESLSLRSTEWLPVEDMREIVSGYSQHSEYGDVYARLI